MDKRTKAEKTSKQFKISIFICWLGGGNWENVGDGKNMVNSSRRADGREMCHSANLGIGKEWRKFLKQGTKPGKMERRTRRVDGHILTGLEKCHKRDGKTGRMSDGQIDRWTGRKDVRRANWLTGRRGKYLFLTEQRRVRKSWRYLSRRADDQKVTVMDQKCSVRKKWENVREMCFKLTSWRTIWADGQVLQDQKWKIYRQFHQRDGKTGRR